MRNVILFFAILSVGPLALVGNARPIEVPKEKGGVDEGGYVERQPGNTSGKKIHKGEGGVIMEGQPPAEGSTLNRGSGVIRTDKATLDQMAKEFDEAAADFLIRAVRTVPQTSIIAQLVESSIRFKNGKLTFDQRAVLGLVDYARIFSPDRNSPGYAKLKSDIAVLTKHSSSELQQMMEDRELSRKNFPAFAGLGIHSTQQDFLRSDGSLMVEWKKYDDANQYYMGQLK